jgi:hypothetical protein
VRVAEGYPRFVVDRNRITGGGISSGLDEALELVALLTNETVARRVQLSVQYRPQPPFDSGDPSTANGGNHREDHEEPMNHAFAAAKLAAAGTDNPFAGKWTYRSYLNRPDVMVGEDAQRALELVFGEGVITVSGGDAKTIVGVLDMGGGYALDLTGSVKGAVGAVPALARIRGIGRAGTPTDNWEYDYCGYLAWTWPDGVAQVPAIVGTVVRAKAHGGAKAGVVASFIAAKQG